MPSTAKFNAEEFPLIVMPRIALGEVTSRLPAFVRAEAVVDDARNQLQITEDIPAAKRNIAQLGAIDSFGLFRTGKFDGGCFRHHGNRVRRIANGQRQFAGDMGFIRRYHDLVLRIALEACCLNG